MPVEKNRMDMLETDVRELKLIQQRDHDLLTEIHTVLCKNGFIATVKKNMDRLDVLEVARIASDQDRRTKRAMRFAVGTGITTAVSLVTLITKLCGWW